MSYGQVPPGGYVQPPPYGAMPPRQHGSAVTALVLGIVSFTCCGLLGIPAYVVGRRAEREVAASNGTLTGEGLARAGWILGLISMILTLLVIVLYIGLVAIAPTLLRDQYGNAIG